MDTFQAEVAAEAVAAGAHMVNDVSGGTLDPHMFSQVAIMAYPPAGKSSMMMVALRICATSGKLVPDIAGPRLLESIPSPLPLFRVTTRCWEQLPKTEICEDHNELNIRCQHPMPFFNKPYMRHCLNAGTADTRCCEGSNTSSMLQVASLGVPYVLMHMRGDPTTMQQPHHTTYNDTCADVGRELQAAADRAIAAGIEPWSLVLDPGKCKPAVLTMLCSFHGLMAAPGSDQASTKPGDQLSRICIPWLH